VQGENNFDLTQGLQTMELVSPASAAEKAQAQRRRCSDRGSGQRAKPLFEIPGRVSETSSTADEDDGVPASWEDVEDPSFPQVKSATASDRGSDDAADDCCNVKPGQLGSSKWSMEFHKRTATPPVRFAVKFDHTATSFSAPPAAPQSRHGGRTKRQSLNLYRPDMDESGDKDSPDWSLQFRTRYETITQPFIDSHCHLDFLFKRSGFSGSFEKYRRCFANTFPTSFSGCVTVFCNPKMWSYESEGKILFLTFCVLHGMF